MKTTAQLYYDFPSEPSNSIYLLPQIIPVQEFKQKWIKSNINLFEAKIKKGGKREEEEEIKHCDSLSLL